MKELDLLKKDWKKNENSYSQKTELDIYKMIHKRSSSIVKWILIISILEVVIWTSVNFLFNNDKLIIERFGNTIAKFIIEFNFIFNCINYVIIAIFIYLFYKNYKAISTLTSTKQLMSDILRTRKTVNYYVWYNLIMLTIGLIIVFVIQLLYSPKLEFIKNNLKNDTNHFLLLKIIGIVSLIVVVIVFLFWLFYKILYGILLRKLYKNYKELKKIEL
jgi:hypothetical protein